MACIYCRRSHMTCDENRPCQRCIKRDIGHLCRNEVTPPNAGSARNRNARKQVANATVTQQPNAMLAAPPMIGVNGMQTNPTVMRHDLSTNATSPSLMALEHSMSNVHRPSFHADSLAGHPMTSSNFESAGIPPFDVNFSSSHSDASLASSPKSKRELDPAMPLLRQLQSISSSAPSSAETVSLHSFNNPSSQSMFTDPSFAMRPSAMRQEGEKGPSVLGTQLGNTAWLGLGGSMHHTGDAGGGSELNLLSEFLESLDDHGVSQTDDVTSFQQPSDNNMSGPMSLFQRPSTNSLLDTPPSMVGDTMDPSSASFTHDPTLGFLPSTSVRTGNYSPMMRPHRRTLSDVAGIKEGSNEAQDTSEVMAASTPCIGTSLEQQSSQGQRSALYPPYISKTATKTERFLLTAADQSDGSRDERLHKVIQAKWEAGLLRPYNHVHGYARLNQWMEKNVSASSRRRILKPLTVFQPVFSALAKNLTSFDLMYIEESFERLLLNYDRVFSIQGIPACLWRRTGEIYKGNKEFAELVGIPIESLRDGRVCIYELMAEESAVNYWEKYGSVSFDPSQKAVLTMCKLRTNNQALASAMNTAHSEKKTEPSDAQKEGSNDPLDQDATNQPDMTSKESMTTTATKPPADPLEVKARAKEPACISCCFSFTIRRDKWNVPTMIVGNFLPTHPAPTS
ncbi:rds2-regulator of drug sensitivity [Malassezia pachydermatis]|uniref:Rds2-regulator of drug sensitivity n=1 Tax=Malassezia pachydermatis TaxID=77020 RepID=A0A0M8MVM7_9BASI|nr:rds2-regulator of drug sensitivity [Malassezia pachydermatis]KOS14690.1 rds2-regulator of drug sensitivity [Malassezia pachydermatis]